MSEVCFKEHHFQCGDNESVLDALIRHNIEVPYSCKVGVCQSCKMRCKQGSVPPASQQELNPNIRELGYFLACQCIPVKDIQIELPDSKQLYVAAELIDKKQLSSSVYRLRLQTAIPIYYHAGQFINVKRADGVIRSYSLASLPSEDSWLELHVKRMNNGVMSNWLADEFKVGDSIEIEGPMGECFYSNNINEPPILLVGTGTGLAPLIGIVRDALKNNHAGTINIYHGVHKKEELYFDNKLRKLMSKSKNIHYHACITDEMYDDKNEEKVKKGRAGDIALSDHPQLNGWQVFICGAPSMVKSVQQRAYLAGALLQDIHTDPFETQDLRKA